MFLNVFFCILHLTVWPVSAEDPLATPEGYLKYDIKKGASFNPEYESVGYWNGSVYGWTYSSEQLPTYERLFLFEGFNIRAAHKIEQASKKNKWKEKFMPRRKIYLI